MAKLYSIINLLPFLELEYEILKQVNQQKTDVVLEIEKLNNIDNYDLPIQWLWKG